MSKFRIFLFLSSLLVVGLLLFSLSSARAYNESSSSLGAGAIFAPGTSEAYVEEVFQTIQRGARRKSGVKSETDKLSGLNHEKRPNYQQPTDSERAVQFRHD